MMMHMLALSFKHILVLFELSAANATLVLFFSCHILFRWYFINYGFGISDINISESFLKGKHVFVMKLIFVDKGNSIVIIAPLVLSSVTQLTFHLIVV